MQKNIMIISAIVACATAAPGLYFEEYPQYTSHLIEQHDTYLHAPVYPVHGLAKSTLTQSSQVVNHGGTTVVHAPVYTPVHLSSAKSTVTKSSQVVNHGGTAVVHAPVYHAVPVHHSVVYSAPLKTGDSAVSHHSSTVHETKPVVNHLPLYYH